MRIFKVHFALLVMFLTGVLFSSPGYSNVISTVEIKGNYFGELASADLILTEGIVIKSGGVFQEAGNSDFRVTVGYSVSFRQNFPVPNYQNIELLFMDFDEGTCPACSSRPYLNFSITDAGLFEYFTNTNPAISDFIKQSGTGILDRDYVNPDFVPLPVSWELFAFEEFGKEPDKFLLKLTHPRQVPEPASLALLVTSLVGIGFMRRHMSRASDK